MDRYRWDDYTMLLWKHPSTLISHFLPLLKDIQQVIAMKYYENHTLNACKLRINGLKVAIEIKAQEMWME